MEWCNKVRKWLTETDTPRWWVVISAVVAFLAATATSYYLDEHSRANNTRAELIQAVVEAGGQFQVFASAFSSEMFDANKVSLETRTNLIQNINDQFSKVKIVEPMLNAQGRILADEYKKALNRMRSEIDNTADILSMRGFWSTASELTLLRNKFSEELLSDI